MRGNKRGVAIVIVLTLAFGLTTLGVAFLSSLSATSKQNSIELGAVQLDLLAEGVCQVAMLKFKEAPAPLYYAALCAARDSSDAGKRALDIYNTNETGKKETNILRAAISTPFRMVYNTEYKMLPSSLYESMHVKVIIAAKLTRPDGSEYMRRIERNIEAKNVKIAQ